MSRKIVLTVIGVFVCAVAAAVWVPAKWPGTTGVGSSRAGATVQAVDDSASVNNRQAPASIDGLLQRIEGLEAQLTDLRTELRLEQTGQLELRRDFAALSLRMALLPAPDASGELPADAIHQGIAADSDPTGERRRSPFSAPDSSTLQAAGADPATAEDIVARLDAYALADLEIRDRAAREGWLEADDFAARRDAELPELVDLRVELGDAGWDNYLYSAGRTNRVVVANVIQGSAASDAGVEAGDTLLSYAGRRMFSVRELQQETRAGERGEVVTVRLSRGDTLSDIVVPRGPLGISLTAQRVAPAGLGSN